MATPTPFKFFASDDRQVGHLLAAVDAAASRCTAAAQRLEAAATNEAKLKGKGEAADADAARATKLAAEQLASAAEEVAVAKKTLAVVTHAVAKAALADASSATNALVDLLEKDGHTPAQVAAATATAAKVLLAIADKQALASAARADAVSAANFAKAATSFAASPTDFYVFSWECVEPSNINQQEGPAPSKERRDGRNSYLEALIGGSGGGGPRGQIIAVAARLVNREMAKHGQVMSINNIAEILRSPIDVGSPQLKAILPHLVTIAPQLPIPEQLLPELLLPSQLPAIPQVLLPPAFQAASEVAKEVQPTVKRGGWKDINVGNAIVTTAIGWCVGMGLDAAYEEVKDYRPDFSKLGQFSLDETPEPQASGKNFE
ncbi:hypothetical protein CFC21_013718 [Triticum aestivum]|uniref:Uncharacterized protein n=3 Tax=Triticinae TaxID=1648030 RepID=A0A9R1IYI4_WHEAT|nr:uncharacterized protein LOC120961809 [Aegilops tauschii subsp. strangulata]XP_044451700.1 uncharacterized protein LOC123183041 [Triticum aestivum]KAF6997502.1 hypothetical protein CFC21_013717 [Triticum aestivum]KAF6997503.1 hypothetical protein CFC21_013718 [Triticum aestivum]